MATRNVFAEFGFDLEVSTIEVWRTDLARIIRECFERSQLSQDAFARKLKIKQSIVSKLVNGRIQSFSVEYLLRLCVRLETRGVGMWGPNPDEAHVATDASLVTGTSTFEPVISFAFEGAVVCDPVLIVTSKKPIATSQTSVAKLH